MILKRNLFLTVLLIGSTVSSFSQSLWQGQYHSKRLILSYSEQDTVFLNSPENGFDSIPLLMERGKDSILLKNDQYNMGLRFSKINGDQFDAVFYSYSSIYNLTFSKVDSIMPITFPQHPKGSLPYTTREIAFKGSTTGINYAGSLVTPSGKKKYPLVFLLNGTGQQDRNYVYSGRQFFSVLADALARKGIASFRMDDRGIGGTTGEFEEATIEDFVLDVEEAIGFIKSDKSVDASNIGLLGHSEGGVIASVATARNKEIKFMISLSGVGVSGMEILDLQNSAILRSNNVPDSLVVAHMDLYTQLFQTVYNNEDVETLRTDLDSSLQAWMKDKDTSVLASLQLVDGREQYLINRFYGQSQSPAYRFMIRYDPKDYLPKIKVPVLIMNGGKDILVPAEENVEGFKKHLVNSKEVTTKIYPGVNHMYQNCITCTSQEVSTLEEVFAPNILEDITGWILKQYNKNSI